MRTNVLLSGLAAVMLSAPALAEPSLVGIWYSAGQPDEPGVMSLIEFKADGTFREEFRKCEKGEVVAFQTETGTWSVMDGIEHTVTDTINGEAAKVEDTYRLERLTETQRRVRLETMDLAFESIRVQEFRFPDCASGV